MTTLNNSIPEIPEDIITEVLSRLPVKSLLRFRCVLKLWDSIISCPRFSKTHLKNSKRPNLTHNKIMLQRRDGNIKHCSLGYLLDEPNVDAFDEDYLWNIYIHSVCSCDGLMCFREGMRDLILWNPLTKKFKKLSGFNDALSLWSYGVGFDKSTDDYKVVALHSCVNNDFMVNIYSVKTGEWKVIKNLKNHCLIDGEPAIFASGKLHWLALNSGVIVSLDLETKEYGVLQKPIHAQNVDLCRLGASEEDLYLYYNNKTHVQMWIIEGYGMGKETWSKMFNIPYLCNDRNIRLLKYGEIVLVCGLLFVIFNLDDGSSNCFHSDFFQIINCVESLVLPLIGE